MIKWERERSQERSPDSIRNFVVENAIPDLPVTLFPASAENHADVT
jgi:hypothetical protein